MKKADRSVGAWVLALSLLAVPGLVAGEEGCRAGPCHRLSDAGEVLHEPLAEERCGACHEGGGSAHPAGPGSEFSLALGGRAALCYSCHQAVKTEVGAGTSIHAPVREGECLRCHAAHDSSHAGLLVKAVARDSAPGLPAKRRFGKEDFALCWDCHDVYMILMKKTTSRTAFRNGSVNLHYAHVSDGKGYACGACHRPHASRGAMLVARPVSWKEDLMDFSLRDDGGECVPGCHEARSYRRGAAR